MGKRWTAFAKLLIGDPFRCHLPQGVDPVVADTIGELFLLAPGDLGREHILEGFPEKPFLDLFLARHLG